MLAGGDTPASILLQSTLPVHETISFPVSDLLSGQIPIISLSKLRRIIPLAIISSPGSRLVHY
jgi:hypothetical protein